MAVQQPDRGICDESQQRRGWGAEQVVLVASQAGTWEDIIADRAAAMHKKTVHTYKSCGNRERRTCAGRMIGPTTPKMLPTPPRVRLTTAPTAPTAQTQPMQLPRWQRSW